MHLIYRHASVSLSTVHFNLRHNQFVKLVCFDSISAKYNLKNKINQALLDRLQVYGLKKKCTSDLRANEKLNWQSFKTHANYVLL